MSCFCITDNDSCDTCEAILEDFRQPDFVPNRLYYHTDVTGKMTLGKVQGLRTKITYEGKSFYIATSLLKKENNRLYVHTRIFEEILEKEFGYTENITKETLLLEVRDLKDTVKELLERLERTSIE